MSTVEFDNKIFRVLETPSSKSVRSQFYNYNFDKRTGFFARWGKTEEDDPDFGPFPEILDLEISAGNVPPIDHPEFRCRGFCPNCYKGNDKGDVPIHNMTLDEFKTILGKIKPLPTQIAFGIMNICTNPDFFSMMEWARKNGVIPNYTTHGLDVDDYAVSKTAELCGAVAVSVVNKEKTYDAVKRFTDAGMTQCNIHFVLHQKSYGKAFEIVNDISTDPRLKKLNAIVFLQYKRKGNDLSSFDPVISVEKYKKLIEHCEKNKVRYGFDSCSAGVFLASIKDRANKKELEMYVDSCESGLFSSYVSCFGFFFPCSFSENEKEWENGIDILNCEDFVKDVWFHPRVKEWRKNLIASMKNGCRQCLMFSEINIKGEEL